MRMLTDGQGAVIPDQQEVEGSVCHPQAEVQRVVLALERVQGQTAGHSPGVEEEAAGEGDENEDDGEVELGTSRRLSVGKPGDTLMGQAGVCWRGLTPGLPMAAWGAIRQWPLEPPGSPGRLGQAGRGP